MVEYVFLELFRGGDCLKLGLPNAVSDPWRACSTSLTQLSIRWRPMVGHCTKYGPGPVGPFGIRSIASRNEAMALAMSEYAVTS